MIEILQIMITNRLMENATYNILNLNIEIFFTLLHTKH